MCGLCGWFGAPDLNNTQRLKRARVSEGLMFANATRGTDASGVATIGNGEGSIYKRAISSHKLVDDPEFSRRIRTPDAGALIGHTRLGTMGKNTDRNAHPFSEGSVIGAHNGVIWNHDEVEPWLKSKDKRWKKPVQVDSQVIFRLLADGKPEGEHYAGALPVLEGQMALTWWDARDPDGMWLFAHDNPLQVAIVPRIATIFWSSEFDHLAAALWAAYGNGWESVTLPKDTVRRMQFVGSDLTYEDWTALMPKPEPYGYDRSWKAGGRNAIPFSNKKWKTIGGEWVQVPDQQYADDEQMGLTAASLQALVEKHFPPKVNAIELDRGIRDGVVPEAMADIMEECALCHMDVTWDDEESAFYNEGEGHMLCGKCAVWWDTDGASRYQELEVALALWETTGTAVNAALDKERLLIDTTIGEEASN